jgi:WD domain, G-beta repeat
MTTSKGVSFKTNCVMCLQVAQAEPEDGQSELVVKPIREIVVPGKPSIRTVLSQYPEWAVLDANGSVTQASWPQGHGPIDANATFQSLLAFCGSDISCISGDPNGHYILACSKDGAVWVHDLESNSVVVTRQCQSGITCILPGSGGMDSEATFYLGHTGGNVTRVVRRSDGIRLAECYRPHAAQITCLAQSPDRQWLVSCAADNTLFLFRIEGGQLQPHSLLHVPSAAAHVSWLNCGIVMACCDGKLRQVQPPVGHQHAHAGTFQASAHVTAVSLSLPVLSRQGGGTGLEIDADSPEARVSGVQKRGTHVHAVSEILQA